MPTSTTSWDIEDENLIYNEKTGLYTKTRNIINDQNEPCQEICEYRLETFEVSKSVLSRKKWKKFGKAKNDPPGPNSAQTYLGDEVIMRFFKDEIVPVEEENKPIIQSVRCRNCQGDHFSHKCPYKEEIKNIQELVVQIDGLEVADSVSKVVDKTSEEPASKKPSSGAYLPPHMRNSGQRPGLDTKRADNGFTLRVSNLPETAQECDLDDLFRPFGSLSRTFLVKNKMTGLSRGFAYVSFHSKTDATKALEGVNGFGFDHCILKVEWSE